jgi:hypothetical protein
MRIHTTFAHALQRASLSDSLADPSGAITVLAPNNGLRGNPMALGEDARQQNCSLILKRLLVSASDSRPLIDSHVSVCMCDVNVLPTPLCTVKSELAWDLYNPHAANLAVQPTVPLNV